jgi:hypothetical protein
MYLNLLISLQYLFTRATVTVHPRPLCVWYFCMSSKILWQVEMKAYDGRGDITENWTHWSILPIVPHNVCHMRMTQIGGLQVLNITIDSFTNRRKCRVPLKCSIKKWFEVGCFGSRWVKLGRCRFLSLPLGT